MALNDEATLMVLDHTAGQSMNRIFLDDVGHAEEITLETFRKRSWLQRIAEWGARSRRTRDHRFQAADAESVQTDVCASAEHRRRDVNLMTSSTEGTWPSVSRMIPPTHPVTAPMATVTSAGAPTSEALTVPARVTRPQGCRRN
jgi:hypothetical protein